MITDFGLSRLKARGSNPIVNSGNFERVGISSRTSSKYDIHYFLNSFAYTIRHMSRFPMTKEFISRVIPKSYLGEFTSFIKEFRLRPGVSDGPVLSLDAALKDPYFHTFKASPPKEVGSPKVLTGGNAASIAAAALRSTPGVSVTVTSDARRPTPAEFMRMSPASRAKFKTKTKSEALGESRSIVSKNVGKGFRRNTVRRVAAPSRTYLTLDKTKSKPAPSFSPLYENVSPHTVKRTGLRKPRTPRTIRLLQKTKTTRGPSSAPARLGRKPKTPPPPPPRVSARAVRAARGALKGRGKPPPATRLPRMVGPSRTILAKPPSPPSPRSDTRLRLILNSYAVKHGAVTTPQLVQFLKRMKVATPRATTVARRWKTDWNETRRNVSFAVRELKAGKNLTRLGFPNSVRRVAQRRVNAHLTNAPNGRVRAGKRLLEGYKKQELLNMARQYGVPVNASMTKDKIIRALFGKK